MNGFNTHETDDLGLSQGSNVPILSRAEIVLSTMRTNIVINPLVFCQLTVQILHFTVWLVDCKELVQVRAVSPFNSAIEFGGTRGGIRLISF